MFCLWAVHVCEQQQCSFISCFPWAGRKTMHHLYGIACSCVPVSWALPRPLLVSFLSAHSFDCVVSLVLLCICPWAAWASVAMNGRWQAWGWWMSAAHWCIDTCGQETGSIQMHCQSDICPVQNFQQLRLLYCANFFHTVSNSWWSFQMQQLLQLLQLVFLFYCLVWVFLNSWKSFSI